MILADTNVWCDFFRKGDALLDQFLADHRVILHSIVIGELAMGNLPSRSQTLRDLHQLPRIKPADRQQCFTLLEEHKLFGKGLQWNDLQILTAVILNPGTQLCTRDKRLEDFAVHFGVGYKL